MSASRQASGGSSLAATHKKPSDFFNTVLSAFNSAEVSAGSTVEHLYVIGGHSVCLRFAGPGLVPLLTPALEHLKVNAYTEPELTVCLFDSSTTGVSVPPVPWRADKATEPGSTEYNNSDPIHIAFQSDVNMLSVIDNSSNLAIFWAKDIRQMPYYERCSPLRKIIHWWMLKRNLQLIHAAAVGTAEGGVLLTGRGGSGKSTSALSCLASQLHYLSDDSCLLQAEPVPYAYSLYNSAKIEKNNLARFPHLKPLFNYSDHMDAEKALVFLHAHYPENFLKKFPVCALLLPHVSGRPETTITAASAAQGLAALAPSTIFHLPGAGAKSFQIMSRLVQKVPSYNLNLGLDISTIPDLISELLLRLKNHDR